MEEGVALLRREIQAAGIALELLHGGEIELGTLLSLDTDTVRRFTIGQGGRYLLIEFPYFGWPAALEGAVYTLRGRGITAIIAHPERNPDLQANPTNLVAVTELGALVQVTAASIAGRFGRSARRAVKELLELGLVHLIASDVHRPGDRETGLGVAAQLIGGGALGRYLTEEVPTSIVRGWPVTSMSSRADGGSSSSAMLSSPMTGHNV
jgi:protein-tyrosine phosphatase